MILKATSGTIVILYNFISIRINESWVWDDLGWSANEYPKWTFLQMQNTNIRINHNILGCRISVILK